jgi:hypothetical protein
MEGRVGCLKVIIGQILIPVSKPWESSSLIA